MTFSYVATQPTARTAQRIADRQFDDAIHRWNAEEFILGGNLEDKRNPEDIFIALVNAEKLRQDAVDLMVTAEALELLG